MKRWRRSGGGRPATAELPPSFLLVDLGAEQVEAQNVAEWVGTHFALLETSPNGVDTWTVNQESPISADPQAFGVGGEAGNFMRGAVTTGNGVPITAWSNTVQVTN